MQFIAQTIIGIEDVAAKEIEEKLSAKAEKIEEGRLKFDTKDIRQLLKDAKSIKRIYRLLSSFNFKELEEITAKAEKLKYPIKGNFKVKCARKGSHDFNSQEAAKKIGEAIFNKGFEVNLEDPDNVVLADIIGKRCMLGIDMCNKDMCKREYRVKASSQSINPCVAYAMVRLSGWKKKEKLLDPMCRDGVIAIEAAMLADGKTVYAYDSLFPHVRSAEINAKLAGVNKKINFSRCELDWLDTKFGKQEIDYIITNVMCSDEKELKAIFKQLFYQAEFMVRKGVVLAVQEPKHALENAKGFKKAHERKVSIGGLSYSILVFSRQAAL